MVAISAKKIAKPAKAGVKKDIKKDKKTQKGVTKDFEIDEDERYQGKTTFYDSKRGFGFIELEQKGIVPDNKIMVHWRELKSSDRWPFLTKDMEVEFSLSKRRQGKNDFNIIAKSVSSLGGDDINLQDDRDSKREFVGSQHMRYLGNVKFFDYVKGFGYVKLQEGYDIPDDIPTELRVGRDEINAGTDVPRLNDDMEVEFGIVKSKKGHYSCYNVTLPEGSCITREIIDGRENITMETFEGKVAFWSNKNSYGMITPDDCSAFPATHQEAMNKDLEERKKKAGKDDMQLAVYFRRQDKVDPTQFLKSDAKVSFKLYMDKHGVGACEVSELNGSL